VKISFLKLLTLMTVLLSSASSCNKEDDASNIENNNPMPNGKIKIKVDSQTFTAQRFCNSGAEVHS